MANEGFFSRTRGALAYVYDFILDINHQCPLRGKLRKDRTEPCPEVIDFETETEKKINSEGRKGIEKVTK